MKRLIWSAPASLLYSGIILISILVQVLAAQTLPDKLLLRDYRPESLYNIPKTDVQKAKYRAIDAHSHVYAETREEIAEWVRTMDEVGLEKVIVMTMATGARFDSIYAEYAQYPGRFEVWCGFDYAGYDEPGFGPSAVAELERCAKVGATGVGELGDKGKGLYYSKPVKAWGMHIDDPRMDPLLEKCGELGLPINIHVGEPLWFYAPMDSTNDGLMSAFDWRLDNQKDIVDLAGMVDILDRAVQRHPNTTFIACHLANLNHDLARLGELLDEHPNLYADISARYAEAATIPRFAQAFMEKYQDRLLYGTDLGNAPEMYRMTFRILESNDEHFYEVDELQYHWPLYGLNLDQRALKKIYRTNILKILNK
ncbi:MAG: amidohydrolase [Fidelibacterota bacterium]|nr:MAG: amidohydrolase [Candidatus Neomarinimicrobiota bacterium]